MLDECKVETTRYTNSRGTVTSGARHVCGALVFNGVCAQGHEFESETVSRLRFSLARYIYTDQT